MVSIEYTYSTSKEINLNHIEKIYIKSKRGYSSKKISIALECQLALIMISFFANVKKEI
jgi:hypothetical protein